MPDAENPPYAISVSSNETIYVDEAWMIRLLSDTLKFKFEILQQTDGEYGLFPDGNWTGMIGKVYREEADMAIGSLDVLENLMSVVDFAYPHRYSHLTFITYKPKFVTNSYAIVHPFSLPVWIGIAISLLIMLFLSLAFKGKKDSYQSMFLNIYGCLLENSMKLKLQSPSRSMFVLSWVIFAMVISYTYKALLLSFLTFPSATGIRNIAELGKATEQNSFVCATYPGVDYTETISNSSHISWRNIGKCLNRNRNFFTIDVVDFLRASKNNRAFIGTKFHLDAYNKEFYVSADSFFSPMMSIAVRKTFC